MATKSGRGIGNMGDIRRPPPLRYFVQLYKGETAFQALIDFAILGGLTIAFLHPPFGHPFSGKNSTAPQQQQASSPSPAPTSQPSVTPSQQSQSPRPGDTASS